MSIRRFLTYLMIAGLCLSGFAGGALPSPAAAVGGPIQAATAKAQVLQVRMRPATMPAQLKSKGRTTLLNRAVKTNAGRTAKVTVTATSQGHKVKQGRDFKVIRTSHGRVVVRTSGRIPLDVKVVMTAPAAKGYTKYYEYLNYPVGSPVVGLGFGEAFTWLVAQVGGGIAGAGGSAIAGWMYGAIMGTNGQPTQLDKIQDQLAQIDGKLDEMTAEITALGGKLADLGCNIQSQAMNDAISVINGKYDGFTKMAANPAQYSQADLVAWALQVSNVGAGSQGLVWTALDKMQLDLLGASAPGALQACLASAANRWTAALGEPGYYRDVYTYLGFYLQIQMHAINMLEEANHVLAANAAIAAGTAFPKDPTDIKKVCLKSHGNATAQAFCDAAVADFKKGYDGMVAQVATAGAGYSMNIHANGAIAARKNSKEVWVTDLRGYGDLGNCQITSASDSPCGPTVGTLGPLMDATEFGYQGWRTATTAQWNSVLLTAKTRDVPQARIMEQVGFATGGVDNLVIYTGETVGTGDRSMQWTWVPGQEPFAKLSDGTAIGLCHLDTAQTIVGSTDRSGVRCQDNGYWPLRDLLNGFSFQQYGSGQKYVYTFDPKTLATSSPAYFAGQISGRLPNVGQPQPGVIDTKPGWMQTSKADALPQYRWPILDRSNPTMACTSVATSKRTIALKPENAAGMPTMCGQDFLDWLGSWLPAAPQA